MTTAQPLSARQRLMVFLWLAAVLNTVVIAVLTYVVFVPLYKRTEQKTDKAYVPAVDYSLWHAHPVNHVPRNQGRPKPFLAAAEQDVLQITGRSKFQGHDAAAIVLQWKLFHGERPKVADLGTFSETEAARLAKEAANFVNWETYPFLYCDHHEVRAAIYAEHLKLGHQPDNPERKYTQDELEELRHGKYVAPRDLRMSRGFLDLQHSADKKRREDPDKGNLLLSAAEQKAEEAWNRLRLFDAISQNSPSFLYPTLHRKAADPYKFLTLPKQDDRLWAALSDLHEPMKSHRESLALLAELRTYRAMLSFGIAGLAVHGVIPSLSPLLDFTFNDRAVHEAEARLLAGYDDYQAVLQRWDALKAALVRGDAEAFRTATQEFFSLVRTVNQRAGPFPGYDPSRQLLTGYSIEEVIDLELQYHRVKPFRQAWILMLLSILILGLSLVFAKLQSASLADFLTENDNRSSPGGGTMGWLGAGTYGLGMLAYAGALVFQVYGFAYRVIIAGRPPVATMYDTVIFVAFMTGLFALVLELIYRKRVIAMAAAMVSTLGLVLADQLPTVLDPHMDPLQAVLRTNFWLIIHVMTIVASYAGGALSWGLANITLGIMVFGSPKREMLKTLSLYTYRGMQIAVLLLAFGTFLGGWWAADAWGRFWGWDPKEVWALIALVAYVIPLHARYVGWVKDFGLAVASVFCFATIVMCWYGVNFVLGAGLHSYGFGGGGQSWIFLAGMVNIEWVILASILYLRRIDREEREAIAGEPARETAQA